VTTPLWYVLGFAFAGFTFVLITIGASWLISHRHRGDRHKEVAACVADQGLDMSLLVGPPHQAEMRLEQVMTLESEKRIGERAVPTAGDPRHGDLGVVVADPPGHPAEEGESPDVSFQERLGAFAGEGAEEERVGVGQRHDEQGHRGRLSVEHDLGLAEVDLGLAGTVGQGDEDFGAGASPGGDGLLDDGQLAAIAVLVTEPLEDPPGGVTLLPGSLAVVLEDLVDDGEERLELGLWPGSGSSVSGGLGVVEDLPERIPVDVELAADRTLALAVDQDATANLRPILHVGEHPDASQHGPVMEGKPPSSWTGCWKVSQGRHVF